MIFIKWILNHKKIILIYIPLTVALMVGAYAGYIYTDWLSDRHLALQKLSKYKLLIDRTEEMKKGYPYTRNEMSVGAKVVDIPTRIYDRNGEVIGEFFEEKREIVPFDYTPKWLINGIIASEDRDFYNHRGISFQGIFRAFIKNVISFRIVQGGSTVTQQLAKVLFTDMERNLKRKIYEAYCAVEIEKLYDKQDIMSMYVNLIYFGNGSYGVESTAKMFFGKSVKELDVVECSMIVATISNPGYYSPLLRLNNSVNKTKRILKSLSDAGYLNKASIDGLFKEFTDRWEIVFDENGRAQSSRIGSFIYSSYRINRAPFFNERIRRKLVEKFGEDAVKRGGLSVYTTIDGAQQDIALKSIRQGITSQRNYHKQKASKIRNRVRSEKELKKTDQIEGALVSLNPYTGEILSYAGGFEFSSTNQNDNVSQIRRQPGSSIKPLIYTAAIESKKITPSTVFEDKPLTFENNYSPKNYDMKYRGPVTVRQALIKSLNTISVQVLNATGYDLLFSYVQKALSLSATEMDRRFMKTLSFALGAYEVSPMENAILHSTIVNGGNFIKTYGIKTVKDYNGNIVWDNEKDVIAEVRSYQKENGKIMDPVASRITVSMLEGITSPGASVYWLIKKYGIDFPCAGKTGTTSNFNDAWFVGYTNEQVTAVWIGNKTGSVSLGSGRSASGVAAPVWASFISGVYKDTKPSDFVRELDGMTAETICTESGQVAGPNNDCPGTAVQFYYSGSEPGKFCPLHVKNRQ